MFAKKKKIDFIHIFLAILEQYQALKNLDTDGPEKIQILSYLIFNV